MTPLKNSIAPAPAVAPSVVKLASLSTFLQQADVCREQAREAARLKRFRSALGLFATASALFRHVSTNGSEVERGLALEQLSSLALEMATYNDLARISHRSAR